MKTMEEINAKYRELCIKLGDIKVKQKGLSNQEDAIYDELNKLDEVAAIILATQTAKANDED